MDSFHCGVVPSECLCCCERGWLFVIFVVFGTSRGGRFSFEGIAPSSRGFLFSTNPFRTKARSVSSNRNTAQKNIRFAIDENESSLVGVVVAVAAVGGGGDSLID